MTNAGQFFFCSWPGELVTLSHYDKGLAVKRSEPRSLRIIHKVSIFKLSLSWGLVRTRNCLGACSCESVTFYLTLSVCEHRFLAVSHSSCFLSRRPQLYTLQWESSPNTATKPTPLPSSMNTNKTSLVRFCEASLHQASVSEMFISVVVSCCARRLSHTHHYASQIKQ